MPYHARILKTLCVMAALLLARRHSARRSCVLDGAGRPARRFRRAAVRRRQ